MDCENCSEALDSTSADGLYHDGEQITCTGCGAVYTISVDDEGEQVWVQGWTCKHGKDDATPCPECDAERDNDERKP